MKNEKCQARPSPRTSLYGCQELLIRTWKSLVLVLVFYYDSSLSIQGAIRPGGTGGRCRRRRADGGQNRKVRIIHINRRGRKDIRVEIHPLEMTQYARKRQLDAHKYFMCGTIRFYTYTFTRLCALYVAHAHVRCTHTHTHTSTSVFTLCRLYARADFFLFSSPEYREDNITVYASRTVKVLSRARVTIRIGRCVHDDISKRPSARFTAVLLYAVHDRCDTPLGFSTRHSAYTREVS